MTSPPGPAANGPRLHATRLACWPGQQQGKNLFVPATTRKTLLRFGAHTEALSMFNAWLDLGVAALEASMLCGCVRCESQKRTSWLSVKPGK